MGKSITFKTNEKAQLKSDESMEESSEDETSDEETSDEEAKHQSCSNEDEEEDEEEEEEQNEESNKSSKQWKPVDVQEIKTFFAICIIMGLVKMSNVNDYWKRETSNFGIYGNNFISSRMARDRWLEIRKHLGFNLDSIREKTIQNFRAHWIPFPEIAVDETLLLFKGRFRHKQHIRGKPHSTGIKVYAMNDKTGFFLDYWFYQGKNGKTIDIVSNFVSKLEKSSHNYTVYTDSYYGSIELAQYLNERNFYFVISCGKNRPTFLFAECLHKELEKGNCSSSVNPKEEMFALSFKDKKIFNVISNYGDPLATTTSRKKKIIPEVVDDYNNNMHGVDKGDRYVNMFMPSFRNRSWKIAALLGVFYITLSNLTIFTNDLLEEPETLKDNLEKLAYFLSPEEKSSKEIQVKSSSSHVLVSKDNRGHCSSNSCSSDDKRTPLYCLKCKKFFHSACFQDTHSH